MPERTDLPGRRRRHARLANSSGQVGRNYMRHLTGSVYGMFKEPVPMYRGTTMAGIIKDADGHWIEVVEPGRLENLGRWRLASARARARAGAAS